MKCLLVSMLYLLSTGMLMAQEVKPTRIYGQIKDFKGGLVTMLYYANHEEDLISVDANGAFEYSKVLQEPGRAMMFFEDYKTGIDLFMENGMNAELVISFIKGEKEGKVTYEPAVDYQGDNADCTAFMDGYMDWWLWESPWPFERIDTLPFAEYRESLAFRRMMLGTIEAAVSENLYRFAWSNPRKDADFECWVESFDRNDPENMRMSSNYVRWYEICHPRAEGESYAIYHLKNLKKIFSNQEVINAFADEYIVQHLQGAPDDMAEALACYKTVSTNREAHAAADKVYEYYKELVPGSQALDFTMTDKKGKTFRLSDFRGKAVYIDVWATWCGPCCAEIPHMEKLAAHYAKDKRIELISISLDEDKAKWEKKLAEDKPEWKQYICLDAFDSQLCKNYDINGIPRFFFFDKDGKVISLEAPRPSEEGIIEYIDKHLAD